MNILILSWRGPGHPNAGGAEIVTHEHAKAWVKAGHKVTLFTSQFNKSKNEELLDGVKIIRRGEAEFGVKITCFKWYLFEKHEKFDLVFDHFHGIPFFTPLYIRVPKVAFIHEVAREVWFLNYVWIKALVGYYLEPLIFSLFYRNIPFITISNSTKNELVKMGIPNSKITIIYDGVNTVKVKKISKNKKKTLIYLGAFSTDKGTEDAIDTFYQISQKDPMWLLWMVGRGDKEYVDYLISKTKKLKIDKKVKFWGFVTEEKKFELLAKSWVMVNPSTKEGWGLTNIEANSVATPVVAYDVSGCRDSVIHGKTGLLVNIKDTKKLAEAVLQIVNNLKRYQRYQQACKNWSNRFSWEESTKKSLSYLKQFYK